LTGKKMSAVPQTIKVGALRRRKRGSTATVCRQSMDANQRSDLNDAPAAVVANRVDLVEPQTVRN
jgi:hypothetical protein